MERSAFKQAHRQARKEHAAQKKDQAGTREIHLDEGSHIAVWHSIWVARSCFLARESDRQRTSPWSGWFQGLRR